MALDVHPQKRHVPRVEDALRRKRVESDLRRRHGAVRALRPAGCRAAPGADLVQAGLPLEHEQLDLAVGLPDRHRTDGDLRAEPVGDEVELEQAHVARLRLACDGALETVLAEGADRRRPDVGPDVDHRASGLPQAELAQRRDNPFERPDLAA